jgi:hypothetical protein
MKPNSVIRAAMAQSATASAAGVILCALLSFGGEQLSAHALNVRVDGLQFSESLSPRVSALSS